MTTGKVLLKSSSISPTGLSCEKAGTKFSAKIAPKSRDLRYRFAHAYPRLFFRRGTTDNAQCTVEFPVTKMHPETILLRVVLLLIYQSILRVVGQQEGAVRLVNNRDGVSVCGRVEIFHDRQWGTVCDDRWNTAGGNVVCKQLGYLRAERIFYTAHYGRGTGPIWMDSVQCGDGDNSLADCDHRGWGVHDCSHSEDAGVCCEREQAVKPADIPIRLRCPDCNVGGSCKACPDKMYPDRNDCFLRSAVRGIMEVQVNGVWGTVSAEGWGWNEATVVCGQLGYPIAFFSRHSHSMSRLWPNYASETDGEGMQCAGNALKSTRALRSQLNSTVLQGVDCHGRESSIQECFVAGVGSRPNPSKNVATVQCAFYPHPECYRSSFGEVNNTSYSSIRYMRIMWGDKYYFFAEV